MKKNVELHSLVCFFDDELDLFRVIFSIYDRVSRTHRTDIEYFVRKSDAVAQCKRLIDDYGTSCINRLDVNCFPEILQYLCSGRDSVDAE